MDRKCARGAKKSWHGRDLGTRGTVTVKSKWRNCLSCSNSLGVLGFLAHGRGQVTPPLAFVWNEEGLRREGRRGLGAADWLGKGGGLGTGFGIPLDWLGSGERLNIGMGGCLGIRYGGRDEGGMVEGWRGEGPRDEPTEVFKSED